MSFEIRTGRRFAKAIKRLGKKYRRIDEDFLKLIEQLESNPYIGADLGNGVRKIRMAISDKKKGRSHGARVITYTVEIDEDNGVVTLLTIYDKSEQSTITAQEIAGLMEEIRLTE